MAIMTLEEVADYLRVSTRTVYDWAQKGKIPGGKIGSSWRFQRSELERWVKTQLQANTPAAATSDICPNNCLAPERVLFLPSTNKAHALEQLITTLAELPQVESRDELHNGIYQREALMSTGIGFGIAVPHVRLATVTNIVMAAAVCRDGIDDYDALDEQPVHLVFMIAAGEKQHAPYLRLLSRLSTKVRDAQLRERLVAATTGEEFLRTMLGEV